MSNVLPSRSAEALLEDEEEVQPAGASTPPKPNKPKAVSTVLNDRQTRGRPVFRIITEKGEGLFQCQNCQHFKTPWRRLRDTNTRVSCEQSGIKADTAPCSFSVQDTLKKFQPISFGEIAISHDMSLGDIQMTRVLLNRREEVLQLEASMPFRPQDRVQFIYANKYMQGIVDSYNRQTVFVRVTDPDGREQILPLVAGSVTRV